MGDLFPVSELRPRYGIGKQTDINRRKHLGITPSKVNGSYYITNQELDLLDSLDEFLKTPGSKMADFSPVGTVSPEAPLEMKAQIVEKSENSLVEIEKDQPQDWLVLVEAVARAIQPPNPISHWEKLKWAANEGILLSTREIFQLLGAKPTLAAGETTWQRGSFIFRKAGKIGSQVGWRVTQEKVE